MVGQMAKASAPPNAVSFTRELYKESHGDFGIMTGFQDEGPVAFAWITYPIRANTNYGLLLVNGSPRILNVEDLKLLDQKTMKQSFQFRDLKGQFPNVNVWPGDRDGKTGPVHRPGLTEGSSSRSVTHCATDAMPAPAPDRLSSTGISTRKESFSERLFRGCSIRRYNSAQTNTCRPV